MHLVRWWSTLCRSVRVPAGLEPSVSPVSRGGMPLAYGTAPGLPAALVHQTAAVHPFAFTSCARDQNGEGLFAKEVTLSNAPGTASVASSRDLDPCATSGDMLPWNVEPDLAGMSYAASSFRGLPGFEPEPGLTLVGSHLQPSPVSPGVTAKQCPSRLDPVSSFTRYSGRLGIASRSAVSGSSIVPGRGPAGLAPARRLVIGGPPWSLPASPSALRLAFPASGMPFPYPAGFLTTGRQPVTSPGLRVEQRACTPTWARRPVLLTPAPLPQLMTSAARPPDAFWSTYTRSGLPWCHGIADTGGIEPPHSGFAACSAF